VVVLSALEQVNRELGTTTVIITHNAVQAEMADRIVYLRDGRATEITRNATRRQPGDLTW
jgi:putative ABC transport system ATP-binding protein